MTETEVARSLVGFYNSKFYFRRYLVVPNVSWGMNMHECDLLALSEAGYANEVEIKTSRADLLRDRKKTHGHSHESIKYLWFAGPAEMKYDFLEVAPERAGVIVVYKNGLSTTVRKALPRTGARAFTSEQHLRLAILGTMRFWTRQTFTA